MMLVLEIEYLAGVVYAAVGRDKAEPDWPPQPDRIFSALVAAWGDRGRHAREAEALEWLERQKPPTILASEDEPRTSVKVFVPPNDQRSDKIKHAHGLLPWLRSRQPKGFPATRPVDPVVKLVWTGVELSDAIYQSLVRLAHDTSSVGHPSSLTRCRFTRVAEIDISNARRAKRRVYEGRLTELNDLYDEFLRTADKKYRPPPGVDMISQMPTLAAPPSSVFGDDWLILEHLSDEADQDAASVATRRQRAIDTVMPDPRASAIVTYEIRAALVACHKRLFPGATVPELISGKTADGTPTRSPHLAIVPLAFVGNRYADGHVMGFAVVPPRGTDLLQDAMFMQIMREVAPIDPARGRRVMTVPLPLVSGSWRPRVVELSPTIDPRRSSLNPAEYIGPDFVFATVTPIALDRRVKAAGAERDVELAAQIAMACRNIGLPEPSAIVVDKHSGIEGAISAYPSGRSPQWATWRLPEQLIGRQLTHAIIRFDEVISGPVLLGAGRFLGLGLCRPFSLYRS